MVAARLTEFNVSYEPQGSFRIAFGTPKTKEAVIDASQVEDLISKSLASYDARALKERDAERQTFKDQLTVSQANQKQLVDHYVKTLETKHAQLMQVYWTENTKQQQLYMQNLLTDFAGYMEEQRSEDLNYIIAKLELMETDKELFKLETGEIINALAENTNTRNTY
jgi:6-pyruvoyl-tetrahydropterin synthase